MAMHGSGGGHGLASLVWQRSAELCRAAYRQPVFDAAEHVALLRRSSTALPPAQQHVHRALFVWRDQVAPPPS